MFDWFARLLGRAGRPQTPMGTVYQNRLATRGNDRMSSTSTTTTITEQPAYLASIQEAVVAQKNLRLYSIAKERNRLKDRIAVLKGQKKRTSHLVAELARLTRLELELEGGK